MYISFAKTFPYSNHHVIFRSQLLVTPTPRTPRRVCVTQSLKLNSKHIFHKKPLGTRTYKMNIPTKCLYYKDPEWNNKE